MVIREDAHSRGLVLVVEDNELMRDAIDNLLDAAGFSGIAYASAEALLAGARVDDGVCIVSDVRLPGISGFELSTRLRAGGTQTPVILIAARDGRAERSKARRCGAAAYLAKPFTGSALLQAIDGVAVFRRPR